MSYLEKINCPDDLKKISVEELKNVAKEVRDAVIYRVENNGGHFGSNLAVVELTVALHYVFNSPVDKFVFDVSHQCYAHKILTGRRESYTDKEKFSLVSGFTAPKESQHDFFQVGHTSTSVSFACGLAKARDLANEKCNVVAIIGDGSLSGGEAFEGLDNAAVLGSQMLVVVNDNEMSIAPNQGGIYGNLKLLRETNGKAELNLFKAMGFDYYYLDEGNDTAKLVEILSKLKDINHPTVLHIHTLKGCGYPLAEQNKESFHWFNGINAKPRGESYESLTKDYLLGKLQNDKDIVVITAGTPGAQGLTTEFREKAGKQFVDVGICEEHAVAFASGLAKGGRKPIFCVASTFLQRSYDQLVQDLCLNGNHAVILQFGSGMSGADATHVGSLDVAETSHIPGLLCLAPTTREEYFATLDYAIDNANCPVAVRVPKIIVSGGSVKNVTQASVSTGEAVAFVGLGESYFLAEDCAKLYSEKTGKKPIVVNPRVYSTLDEIAFNKLKNCKVVVTIENSIVDGGFGEKVARFFGGTDVKVLCYGAKKEFTDRKSLSTQLDEYRLRKEFIVEDVLNVK